jgi:hypothetical protein
MRKKTGTIQWVLCTAMLGMLSCAKLGEEKQWNNPFDPSGTNWHPPTVVAPGDTNVAFNDTVALGATGWDDNGSIVKYWWSFDRGKNWPLSGTFDTPARRLWGAEGVGAQVVWVKAQDNDGIFSLPDSCVVIVHTYRPTIRQVADTVVSQVATVSITLSAADTNGAIVRYFWKTGIQGPWSDSTMTPQFDFSHPQGGGISIVWGAEDHDGLLCCDTFAILFNRGPVAVEMLAPRNNDSAQFTAFNFIEQTGTARLCFSGSDPDSSADTLTYTLFLGKEPSALVPVWTGRETEVVIPDLESASTYSWKLRAKDLFGDSIENNGTFRTPRSPNGPAGMVLIRSAGKSFTMGLPGGESYETPVHTVAFSYHLWIDTTEVTCREFGALMGGSFENSALPVTEISWFDAILYCNARSKRDNKDTVYGYTGATGTPGKGCVLDGVQCTMKALGYRLPTEAECMPAAQVRSRAGSGATAARNSAIMPGIVIMPEVWRIRPAQRKPTPLVCTIYTETCGSGATTGSARSTTGTALPRIL